MKIDINREIEVIKNLINESEKINKNAPDGEYKQIAIKFRHAGEKSKKILQANYPKPTESKDKQEYAKYFLDSISDGIRSINNRTLTQAEHMKSFIKVLENMLTFFTGINFPTELYHFTKCESMYAILNLNTLKPSKDGYVSMTRDDEFYKKKDPRLGIVNHQGPEVRIKLNRTKLSSDYHIELRSRYHYAGDEQEEAIKGQILNVIDYMIEIDVLMKLKDEDYDLPSSFFDEIFKDDPKCLENIKKKLVGKNILVNVLQR